MEDAAAEASVLLAAAEVVSAELSEDAPVLTVKSSLLARTPAESMIWIS